MYKSVVSVSRSFGLSLTAVALVSDLTTASAQPQPGVGATEPEVMMFDVKSSNGPIEFEIPEGDDLYQHFNNLYVSAAQSNEERKSELVSYRAKIQNVAGSAVLAEVDHELAQLSEQSSNEGPAQKTQAAPTRHAANGELPFDLGWIKGVFRQDFLALGAKRDVRGRIEPIVAGSFSSSFKIKKIPGRFLFQYNPAGILGLGTVHREIDFSATEAAKQGTAQFFGGKFSADQVEAMALKDPRVAAVYAVGLQRAEATAQVLKDTVATRAASLKAGLTRAEYCVDSHGFSLCAGKKYHSVLADIVPFMSSAIWGANPFTSASKDTKYAVYSFTVYSDRGTRENLSGAVSAFVLAAIHDGPDFFSIDPNSYEASVEAKQELFNRMKMKYLTFLMAGAGSRKIDRHGLNQAYTYARTDLKIGRMWGQVLAYIQNQANGVYAIRVWSHVRGKVTDRVYVGGKSYRVNGVDQKSFRNYTPYLEVQIPVPQVGLMKGVAGYLVAEWNYVQGPRAFTEFGKRSYGEAIFSIQFAPKTADPAEPKSILPAGTSR